MARTFGKVATLAVACCGYASIIGCSGGGDVASKPEAGSEESVGKVGLALQLASGATINSASYTITGPGGFTKAGTIDLSSATKLTATVGGLPAGAGYSITLSATTTNGSTTCGGSASFSVVARQTASVSVPMACREAPRTGSVLVKGELNLCPSIDGISTNPAEVQVGKSLTVSAVAHDSDAAPSALTYAWTASNGTLSSATAQNPSFTCTAAGPATLTLSVSDGDPAASCADTLTAVVNCSVVAKAPGTYVTGDFHNHTTCSDGSISMQKLVSKSTGKDDGTFGLDWFVQAGHGGGGNRNCQLVEDATLSTPAYPFIEGKGPTNTWVNSGVTPKGLLSGAGATQNMWRWQSVQEFQYPVLEYLAALKNLPLFLGVETVVPGHEHTSMAVITGQMPAALDTAALSDRSERHAATGRARLHRAW